METALSFMDQQIIRQQLHKLKAEAIAGLIEQPLEAVTAAIAALACSGYLLPKVPKLKKLGRPKKEEVDIIKKASKEAKALAVQNEINRKMAIKAAIKAAKYVGSHNGYIKKETAKYKTKEVDLSNKISVRINAKTVIFVNPGDDIEKIKKMYIK